VLSSDGSLGRPPVSGGGGVGTDGAKPRWFGLRPWPLAATILLAGLAIREALSFWTGHPYDFEVWIRTGYVVAHGTNPYIAFWPAAPGVSIDDWAGTLPSAAYLPFWPLVTGGSYQAYLAVGGGNRFVYYFLLKQGPILADVATAYLLYRLVRNWTGDLRLATRAMAFWSFFPYAIVVTAVWGQFDSIEVVILLSLLLVSGAPRRNLLYGLGIFVKWVTVVYLPFDFFRERGRRRAWILLALAVPLALTAAIFLAMRWPFTGIEATAGSESAGGSGGMNYARLFSQSWAAPLLNRFPDFGHIFPYVFVPAVILVGWVIAQRVVPGRPEAELGAMMAIMTAFFLTRWGLNEQYFLYLFAPMLIDVMVFHPGRRAIYTFIGTLASAFLFVNNTFGVWFLTPINSGYNDWIIRVDSAPVIAPIRQWVLISIALLITVTLAQLLWVFLKDESKPTPWIFQLWPSRRRTDRPSAVSPAPEA